jgi:hypothetical protein
MNDIPYFFQNEACNIFYNEELKVVETSWRPIQKEGVQLQEILNKIIELLTLQQSAVIIADARQMRRINEADIEWIGQVWYPNAVKAGFRYEALIVSADSFDNLSIKKIVDRYYDEITLHTGYFWKHEHAVHWIKNSVPIAEISK